MIGIALRLREYKSHKVVHAGKIVRVTPNYLIVEQADGEKCELPRDPVMDGRYTANIGDYYIVHDDGYASIASAMAFVAGYSQVSK
jgi:hypothetical protein